MMNLLVAIEQPRASRVARWVVDDADRLPGPIFFSIMALGLLLILARATYANDSASPAANAELLSERYVDLFIAVTKDKAELVWLEEESQRLSAEVQATSGGSRFLARLGEVERTTRSRLLEIVKGNIHELNTATRSLDAENARRIDELRRQWIALGAGTDKQRLAMRAETRLHLCIWIVLGAISACFASLAMYIAFRHWLRRKAGRWIRLAYLACIATVGLVFLLPSALIDWALGRNALPVAGSVTDLPQDYESLQKEHSLLQQPLADARTRGDVAWRRWIDAQTTDAQTINVRTAIAPTNDAPSLDAGKTQLLAEQWRDVSAGLRTAAINSRLLQALAAAVENQRSSWEQVQARQAAETWVQAARLAWPLAAVVLCWGLVAAVQRHQHKENARCPKCYHKYDEKTTKRRSPAELERTPGSTHVLCTYPWDGTNACDFEITEDSLAATKLCFPIVGIPATGKSYWLAVSYDRVHSNDYPEKKDLQFAPIDTAGAVELKGIVDSLHAGERHLKPSNAQTLPDPVIFNFTDRDRLGRSNILLTIFDYPGEALTQQFLSSALYRRMLRADGILLFFDPTKKPEDHLRRLNKLINDAKKVGLQAPVAVCVTKIDELENAFPKNADVSSFLDQLGLLEGDLHRHGKILGRIEARSALTSRLMRKLWTPTDVETSLKRAFRDYRFFPVTSTGFTKAGDPLSPHYTIEPLMWLLHKLGYRVFPS